MGSISYLWCLCGMKERFANGNHIISVVPLWHVGKYSSHGPLTKVK